MGEKINADQSRAHNSKINISEVSFSKWITFIYIFPARIVSLQNTERVSDRQTTIVSYKWFTVLTILKEPHLRLAWNLHCKITNRNYNLEV